MKSVIRAAVVVSALGCVGLLAWVVRLPRAAGRERMIAAFATGVGGRTQSQLHNVRLALAALDGKVIAPAAEFSFNRAVGPWTVERGYRRAPVSFSGDLVLDWGGGVCQASTTLYNAALLAGFPITERHRHQWPATYVPPGQDAAVAHPNIDLRFRNSLGAPVRISARIAGESVLVRLYSRQPPPPVRVEREVLAVTAPAVVVRSAEAAPRRAFIRGRLGCQVAVYRTFTTGAPRRELVSRDTYPPRNQVVFR